MATEVPVTRNLSRVVVGLSIICAGILFTLDNVGVVHADTYLAYWPVVLVVIGFVQLAQSRTWGAYAWAMVLIFGGAWILGENLGIVSMSIWTLSPLLLVLLGASIIWRGCCPTTATAPHGAPPQDGNSFIRGTAVVGGFERTSDSADFRGADLVSIMGGCKLDLRHAAIGASEAVIDVTAVMGGVELRVPEAWAVDAQVVPFIGGVTNHTHTVSGPTVQRLVVRGNVFMGGVEIKN